MYTSDTQRDIRVGQAFNLAFKAALLEFPGDIDKTVEQARNYAPAVLDALNAVQEAVAVTDQRTSPPAPPAGPPASATPPPPPPPPPGGIQPSPVAGGGGSKKDRAWQDYFANPGNYYDNRYDKRSPAAPDFKHKQTGEGLWLGGKYPAPQWVLDRFASL